MHVCDLAVDDFDAIQRGPNTLNLILNRSAVQLRSLGATIRAVFVSPLQGSVYSLYLDSQGGALGYFLTARRAGNAVRRGRAFTAHSWGDVAVNGRAGSETVARCWRARESLRFGVGRSPRTSPSSWAADRAVFVSPLQGSVSSLYLDSQGLALGYFLTARRAGNAVHRGRALTAPSWGDLAVNGSAGSKTLAQRWRARETLRSGVGRSPRTSRSSWAADRAVFVSPLQGSVYS